MDSPSTLKTKISTIGRETDNANRVCKDSSGHHGRSQKKSKEAFFSGGLFNKALRFESWESESLKGFTIIFIHKK